MKVFPKKTLEENPNSTLSITLNNIVYLEDVGSYFSRKLETIGNEFMNKDMEIFFNHDTNVKSIYEHLKDLDFVRYYFYHKLDTKEQTLILLSRIHIGKI